MKIKLLLVGWLLSPLGFAADLYEIDTAHTSIGFGVKHMTVSTVKGDFKKYSGKIMLDEKEIKNSSVNITIETGSIDTANAKRDEHLRADDFFAAAKYPNITFASRKIEKKGGQLLAVGDLTMRGVTKEVKIPFTLNGPVQTPFNSTNIGVEGALTINRQEWGISWNKTLDKGGYVVGDEVKIDLNVEAVKKVATPEKTSKKN